MRAERFEMRIVLDPPAPSVCDDDRLDSARMLAREIQADRPGPIRHEQRQLAEFKMVDKGGRRPRVGVGMMVFRPGASRREAETNVVGRHTPILGSKRLDQMPKLEGSSGIAMFEHDRLNSTFVDKVHTMPRRGGVELALQWEHFL